MAMMHLESGDDETNPVAIEHLALRKAHSARHIEDMSAEFARHVDPVIDGQTRHDERMPVGNRRDGHEHHAVLVFQGEMAGKFALDDLGEQ